MKKFIFSAALLTAAFASAQNTGIGTTDPQAKLEIKGDGGTSATKSLKITNSAGTEYVTALDNGRVGIGIATPSFPLHVAGKVQIGDIAHNKMGELILDPMNDIEGGQITVRSSTKYPMPNWTIDQYGGQGSPEDPPRFRIFAGNNEDASLSILENGNVGIGTANAQEKLHVTGNILVRGDATTIGANLPTNGQYPNLFLGTAAIPFGGATLALPTVGSTTAGMQNVVLWNKTDSSEMNLIAKDLIANGDISGSTIQSSSLAGTGDRAVIADSNGVLKPGTVSAAQAASKWTNDTANTAVKLTNLSDGTTARPDAQNIFIKDNGRIGINVVNPSRRLHVGGNAQIGDYASGQTGKLILDKFSDTAGGQIIFNRSSANSTQDWTIDQYGGDGTAVNPARFRIFAGDGTTANMSMSENGNVGIGTAHPSEKIEVSGGNILVQGTAGINGFYPNLFMGSVPYGPDYPTLNVPNIGSKTPEIQFIFFKNVANNAWMTLNTGNIIANGYINVTDHATFQKNVMIGANSIPTEMLDVAGKVKATNFIATTTGSQFPDYVFQSYYSGKSVLNPNYMFGSLANVEDYIKKNGHLPGYQSADEIAKAGSFDMTKVQLTNVEKIEELYLHTIEQEKALKSKDQQIKSLEDRITRLEQLLSK